MEMSVPVRKLKVRECAGAWRSGVPVIHLEGKWLLDAGYKIGDSINLILKDGEMHISKDKDQEKE